MHVIEAVKIIHRYRQTRQVVYETKNRTPKPNEMNIFELQGDSVYHLRTFFGKNSSISSR